MTKLALRAIRSHLGRFVMSIVAVLLGVAFVSGTFALRTMLSGTFDDIIATSAQADVYVRGPEILDDGEQVSGGPFTSTARELIPLDLVNDVADVPGVSVAIPDITGSVILVGADGTAVSTPGGAPSFGFNFDPDDPTATLEPGGRAPQPGEIVLESSTMDAAGLQVGDETKVIIGGLVMDVTVVGEVAFDTSVAGALIVLVDEQTALDMWAPEGLIPDIAIYADADVDPEQLASDVATAVGDSGEVVTGEVLRDESAEQIRTILGFIGTFLLVFAAIALFVGAFIIANTFQMAVRQRQREFAMLRAVGASPGQVFGSILIQALVVGVLGSLGGIAAGVGLVSAMRAVLAVFGMEMSGDIPLDASNVTISLAVGSLVSVVAAALPARKAALTPPVEAMRDQDVRHDTSSDGWFAAAGAVLLVGGAAAVGVAVQGNYPDQAGVLLGAGAAGVLLGSLVLAPVLVPGTLTVLAWPVAAILRPLGGLARGNVTRNSRRTATTAGALMVGMALVGAASVIATSTQASVREVVGTEVAADLLLQSATFDLSAEAVAGVEKVTGVADVITETWARLSVDGDLGQVDGVTRDLFDQALSVPVVAGDLASLDRGDAVARESAAEERGWAVGDSVVVEGEVGKRTVRIGAIVDTRAITADIMLEQSVLSELSAQVPIGTAYVVLDDGADLEAVQSEIAEVVKPYLVISVLSAEEAADALAAQVDQVLITLYALLGLSVVIAVLGIVNTLALSLAERTREIGLLRAVGLGRLQLGVVITIESVLTAVFGTVFGLVIGVGLAATLPTIYADQGLDRLVIPWLQLSGFVGLAVVVGVLAALWPAGRAARMDVLDAISYE